MMFVLLISKCFCAKFTNTLALLNPSPHIPISNRLGNGEDRYISISPPNLMAEKLHLSLASPPTDGFGVNDVGEDALKPVLFLALSLEGRWDPHQTDLTASDPFYVDAAVT